MHLTKHLLLFLLLLPVAAKAQEPLLAHFDTIQLETVHVISDRGLQTRGFKSTRIASETLKRLQGSNLSDVLSSETPIFVKQYGPSGISTVSVRGAGASHTQVLWNGLNLNSPMLGQMDFNSVPVYFVDKLSLHHGGQAMSNSKGSLGGSLNLYNTADWQKEQEITLRQEAGNFRTINSYASLLLGDKSMQSKTRLLFNHSNTQNAAQSTGRTSRIKRYGGIQELYYRYNKRNLFSAKIWVQENESRIRQTEFNKERTRHRFIRGVLDWKHYEGEQVWTTKLGATADEYQYHQPSAATHALNTSHQVYFSENYTYNLSNSLKFQAGINAELQHAVSDNYRSNAMRILTGFYAGANFSLSARLTGYALLKQGFTDTNPAPLTPSLGLAFQLVPDESFFLKTNLSGNYRRPSLNDIHWQPGGNKNLQPEKGISGETGLEFNMEKPEGLTIKTEHTLFYSRIHNWIVWLPGASSYWQPENIRTVQSRGYEMQTQLAGYLGRFKLRLRGGYSYTRSINQTRANVWDQSKNKQLLYVPLHKANTSIKTSYKGYEIHINQTFTGKRYTTTDNTSSLPPFALTDMDFHKTFSLSKGQLKTGLHLRNLFNKHHEVMQGYPLPGRTIKLSLHLKIH